MKLHIPVTLTIFQEIDVDEEIDCFKWDEVPVDLRDKIADFMLKMNIPQNMTEEQFKVVLDAIQVSKEFNDLIGLVYNIRKDNPLLKAEISPFFQLIPFKEV